MSRIKLLTGTVIALILINLMLLALFLFSKGPMHKHGGPRQRVIKELQLDAKQVVQYDSLILVHRSQMEAQHKLIKSIKNIGFTSLIDTMQNNNTDSIMRELANAHVQLEQFNLKHFADIKALCKPEQIPLFNNFCLHIADFFGRPKHEKGE